MPYAPDNVTSCIPMIRPIHSSDTTAAPLARISRHPRAPKVNSSLVKLPEKFNVRRTALPFLAQVAPRRVQPRRVQPRRVQPRRAVPPKIAVKTANALKTVAQYLRGQATVSKVTAALNYLYTDGELSKVQLTTLVRLLRRLIRSSNSGVADAAINLYASHARSKLYFTAAQVHQCAKDLRALFTRTDTVIREAAAFHYASDVAHRLGPKERRAEAKALRRMFRLFRYRNPRACLQAVYAYRRLAPWVDANEAREGAKALRLLFWHPSSGVRMYAREAYANIVPRLKAADLIKEGRKLRRSSRSKKAYARKCVVEGLGYIAVRLKGVERKRSISSLIARLKDRKAADVRKHAARSLGRIAKTSSKPESNRVAKKLRLVSFTDRAWHVRLEGVQTYEKHFSKLGKSERARGETALKLLMKDGDGQVRTAAVKVYCEKYVPAMNANQMKAAVAVLKPLANDENTWIKWYATQALKLIAGRVSPKPPPAKPPRRRAK